MTRRMVVLAGGTVLALSWPLAAAGKRPLKGFVTDSSGRPIRGAVVQVKNAQTSWIRSCITGADGAYQFQELSTSEDYEVRAQHNGKWSSEKTLSQFDSRPKPVINLQIEEKS